MSRIEKWAAIFLLVFVNFLFASLPQGESAVPSYINFQGKLTDSSSNPLTGTYDIAISIYTASSGGTPIYVETHSDVSVSSGIFNLLIGNGTASSGYTYSSFSSVPFDVPYWIGVQVEGETLTPRQRLVSVGYGINADKVDNIHASTTATANYLLALDADKDLELGTGDVNAADATLTGNLSAVNATMTGDLTVGTDGTTNYLYFENGTTDVGLRFNESTSKVEVSHDGSTWSEVGGAVAWDDIGDPDADDTIALTGYEVGFSTTIDEASGVALTVDHTDTDGLTNDTYLLELQYSQSTPDANARFLNFTDNNTTQVAYVDYDGRYMSSVGFDGVGAVGLTFGSSDVTGMTFSSDGTGNAEFTFPADVIGDADLDWGTGAGQISIADLSGDQASGALVWDFGGVTSFEVPQDVTVDAVGKWTFDTTDTTVVYHDGTAARVFADDIKMASWSISNDGDWTDNRDSIFRAPKDMAITLVQVTMEVYGTGVTVDALTLNIEEVAYGSLGSTGTNIFSSDVTVTESVGSKQTSFSNASIAQDATLNLVPSGITGTPDVIQGTFYYRLDLE